MHTFTADHSEVRAYSKELRQTGVLSFWTRIDIRGNYRQGSVPVAVTYEMRFVPDEQHWERDKDFPEDEPYSRSYPMSFDTPQERTEHCHNFYGLIPATKMD
jgi:hypothetical protein